MSVKNSLEVEQKYRILTPGPYRKRLGELKAKKIAAGFESNELFDRDRMLQKSGCAFRLRRYGGKTILTLKGPRQRSSVKKRMELEAEVPESHVRNVLRELGFRCFFSYSKTREIYRYSKTTIVLDHLKKLGWFLEIEGAPAAIRKMQGLLGLQPSQIEPKTYPQLLAGTVSEKA